MRRALFTHRANWYDIVTGVAGMERDRSTTQPAAFACLYEPLPTKAMGAILGRVPKARGILSWPPGTGPREGSRVTDLVDQDGQAIGDAGAVYILREVRPDIYRRRTRYFTAVLEERK